MNMRARIGLLVQAQGATRAASDIGGVARQVDRVGDRAEHTGRRMRTANSSAAVFQRGIKGLTGTMKYGAIAAAALGLAIGKGAIDEYREAFKAGRATANAITATGHAANVSRKHIENRANAISLSAGIDDEAIQSTENLLLTFKKVHNEVGKGNKIFDQATKTAVDMSATYGQSLRTSAIQLGKALQDPVKGAAALKRTSAIDQHDIDSIKRMAKAHKSLGDQQKYVLRAINEAGVKGKAAAIADPFDKAKVAWDNFKETLGFGIAPVLKSVLRPFTPFARDLSRIFARKDIDFGEKMRLGFESAKRHFGPFVTDLWNKLRSAGLPQKMLHAVESAVPILIDHIAAAGPKAAKAFIQTFANMGPWGQLLTVAYLAKKLGAFPALGRMAASRFSTAFIATSGTQMAGGMTLVGGKTGPKWGSKMASTGATALKAFGWAGVGLTIAQMLGVPVDKWWNDFKKSAMDFVGTNVVAPVLAAGDRDQFGVLIPPNAKRPGQVPGPHGWKYPTPPKPTGGVNGDGHSAGDRELVQHLHVHAEGREIGTVTYRQSLRDLAKQATS